MKRRGPPSRPPGDRISLARRGLQAGSALLQSRAPLRGFDIYVAGFHCAKGHPEMQMEAHHFCAQVNEDVFQCVIFDGNTRDANLIGVEYIISERLFDGLPEDEKPDWHPHNFEVLSGQLTAPGLPAAAEKALVRRLINSYGKTWHTWHTGRHDGHGPPGPAMLMWSFNRDGEVDPALHQDFNRAMGIDETAKRAHRQDLSALARPQRGVALMRSDFPHADGAPPGVRDVDDEAV